MRWLLLYSNGDGEPRQLIVDDTTNSQLPVGNARTILQDHGTDFNDGGCVFIVEVRDEINTPDVFDIEGDEIAREFTDL